MMLAIRSHANAKLIQLARYKFKVSLVKFVGICRHKFIISSKKSLNMLKTCCMGVIHEIF